MLFSKAQRVIGLDIGSSSVKVIELQETPKGYSLEKFGMAPLPPEVIVDGTIMDAGRVVEAIAQVLQSQKVKAKDAVFSVSGHSVIIKRVTLPEMSEEELSESIHWEAEQYIPFAIDEVNLDFQILGSSGSGKQAQMDVLLVAVKREKINDYITVVTEAGLTPAIVDVDAFAIQNMYEINYEVESRKVIALVNIGAAVTNINILKDGTTAFTRDSTIGGNQYTEAIQKEFGLSYDDAEKVKQGEGGAAVSMDEIDGIVQAVSGDVATEISRSFDFFKATSTSQQIDRVILSGGCSRMRGLPSLLGDRLGVPVEIASPFKNIHIDTGQFDLDVLKKVAPMAAVGVGLALRRVGDR